MTVLISELVEFHGVGDIVVEPTGDGIRGSVTIGKDAGAREGNIFMLTDKHGCSMSTDEAWGVATAILKKLGATISLIDGARVLTAVKPTNK